MKLYRKSFLKFKILALSLLVLSMTQGLYAESFRVRKTHVIRLDSPRDKQTSVMGINDAMIIRLPKDDAFIQGVELSIKVPKVVADWTDSVAWSLYTGISESANEKTVNYSAKRIKVGTFASGLSLNLKIPVKDNHSIKQDAYSLLVNENTLNQGNFIFFRLQLAMKGTDDEIYNSQFTVSVKPILEDKGVLRIETKDPFGTQIKPYTVFIDGKQTEIQNNEIVLHTGTYNISFISDYYRNELREVTIEQAKTSVVSVDFRDIRPLVQVIMPSNAKVFFDDAEIKDAKKSFYTVQGKHTIKFVLGDYELIKTLTVANGKNYTISLEMDASVQEE